MEKVTYGIAKVSVKDRPEGCFTIYLELREPDDGTPTTLGFMTKLPEGAELSDLGAVIV